MGWEPDIEVLSFDGAADIFDGSIAIARNENARTKGIELGVRGNCAAFGDGARSRHTNLFDLTAFSA